MSIVFHKRGLIIYCIALALSIVFASFFGGPVSFVWLYAMLLLVPISFLYIFINYKFLSLYQEIELHKVTKGDTHNFRVALENTGMFGIHRMSLGVSEDRCDIRDITDGQRISLYPREKAQLTSGISCRYAGNYDVGIMTVSFTDPFGIFTMTFQVPYTFRAVVSPRITDMAQKALDLENLVNSTGLKSATLNEDIYGSDMRAYEKGDPLSAINWKVSARLSEMVVRLPDRMEKRTVTIYAEAVDVPERDQDLEFLKKRDYFLEFIVSAAWHFAGQGVPVRLIYPAGEIKESIVDSYESFMDFYNIVADGIFYRSSDELKKLKMLAMGDRAEYGTDSRILIREDPGPGETNCTIID